MANKGWISSTATPFRIVFLMWLVFTLEFVYGWQISPFGIVPRSVIGLIGIFTAPLIHGSLPHLISNTLPLLFLGSVIVFFYGGIGSTVFFRAYFWTNILVWLFGRTGSNHIGASGIVYALAFFLIFFGFFRRDFRSLIISICILALYGGIFFGILPHDPRVSWESHLAGALVGIATALHLSKFKKVE
jgi:membrane associated rhomboid family serine protease